MSVDVQLSFYMIPSDLGVLKKQFHKRDYIGVFVGGGYVRYGASLPACPWPGDGNIQRDADGPITPGGQRVAARRGKRAGRIISVQRRTDGPCFGRNVLHGSGAHASAACGAWKTLVVVGRPVTEPLN